MYLRTLQISRLFNMLLTNDEQCSYADIPVNIAVYY